MRAGTSLGVGQEAEKMHRYKTSRGRVDEVLFMELFLVLSVPSFLAVRIFTLFWITGQRWARMDVHPIYIFLCPFYNTRLGKEALM